MYSSVVSTEDAKNYLRIDSDALEDDRAVERMRDAACKFVENWTGYVLVNQDKTYLLKDGQTRIYDFPIVSVVTPTDYEVDELGLYSIYYADAEEITLNVGYEVPSDIPQDLRECIFDVIEFYYGSLSDRVLSPLTVQTLNYYKRFIV